MPGSVGARPSRLIAAKTIIFITQTIIVIITIITIFAPQTGTIVGVTAIKPICGFASKALRHVLNIIFQTFLKLSCSGALACTRGQPSSTVCCFSSAVSFTMRAQLGAFGQPFGTSSHSLGVTSFFIRPAHC
jgi:hypothetical protein